MPNIIDRAKQGKLTRAVGDRDKLSDFTYIDNLVYVSPINFMTINADIDFFELKNSGIVECFYLSFLIAVLKKITNLPRFRWLHITVVSVFLIIYLPDSLISAKELPLKAPIAAKNSVTIKQHGQTRVDEYQWLRDENWQKIVAGKLDFKNPDILKYLEAEAAYKNKQMADYLPVKKSLYDEILSRIEEDYQSWPEKKGDFLYYYREEKGKNYPIFCRRYQSMDAVEQIYFDINVEAEDHDLFIFGNSATNRANSFLAYGYNLTGSMDQTIKVRNLATGKDLDWSFPNTTGSIIWLDNEHLLVVERDEYARGSKVYSIDIHAGPKEKVLVYTKPEKFENMILSLGETTDREYLMIDLSSGSSQVLYLSPRSNIDFKLFTQGKDDVTFNLDHYQGDFFILTNLNAANNFQLYKTSVKQWEQRNWQLIRKESETISLEGVQFYNHFMIIEQKNNEKALNELVVVDMDSGKEQLVKMPDAAYELDFSGAWDHMATSVWLNYSSPIRPATVIELDLNTVTTKSVFTKKTPHFNPDDYEVSRKFANARDGESIPITIIFKKGQKLDGTNPIMIYGYGSYGSGETPGFASTIFSLVNRGFVYAIAHIRGGDEKGYKWYLDGKMHNKMNTFNDFIDVTEYLLHKDYGRKGNVAISGGSAGGLLMGAVTNLRPDLFDAVIADVPFVDIITTLPLTPPEWEEWGNPIENEDDFNYIMQYSPYDNVKAKRYPPMLFNTGISDEQVTYWEPAKMVARLRDRKTDDNLLLLNVNMHVGHAGASKRYECIDEIAFNYAFILKCFGMK